VERSVIQYCSMLDVILRACRHPISYSGIRRITTLTFKEKIHEVGDIYSFIFTAEKLPDWRAGQHSIFTIPGRPIEDKTWRPFSIASAPHENEIRIGTIVGPEPSSFKHHLSTLNPGDKVRMFGPYGELYVNKKMRHVVGVAGGIGITPFRSIMADLAHAPTSTKLTLIYSARVDQHVYKAELEKWRSQNPNLEVIYTTTPEEVNSELTKQVERHKNAAHYLLSGPPKMIEALRDNLYKSGIARNHVLNDPFKGY